MSRRYCKNTHSPLMLSIAQNERKMLSQYIHFYWSLCDFTIKWTQPSNFVWEVYCTYLCDLWKFMETWMVWTSKKAFMSNFQKHMRFSCNHFSFKWTLTSQQWQCNDSTLINILKNILPFYGLCSHNNLAYLHTC